MINKQGTRMAKRQSHDLSKPNDFIAVVFPDSDATSHIEVPEAANIGVYGSFPTGIIFDCYEDLRGIRESLEMQDEPVDVFSGTQIVYGRKLKVDNNGDVLLRPIQFTIHEDRAGMDKTYSEHFARIKAAGLAGGRVLIATLSEGSYEDLESGSLFNPRFDYRPDTTAVPPKAMYR